MNLSPDRQVSGLELWQWRRDAIAAATVAGVPLAEVDWLLLEMAEVDKLSVRLESYKQRSQIRLKCSLTELSAAWQRRISDRVPVQYLAGVTHWRNFDLSVTPDVLIPRPETEGAIDAAIAACQTVPIALSSPLETGHWADLGTGSGAIAIGLADRLPDATLHAVDRSETALAIARHNAERLGFSDRIHFYCGSWFQPLQAFRAQLSGVVSNPPYIPTRLVSELQPEVAQHEPHLALDGGSDGLDCIRHLIATAPIYLRPGGILLLEMMAGQAEAVTELLQRQGSYCQIEILSDLAGIERFARAYRV